MKQEEKNRKSREHIPEYAFGEFARQGYQPVASYAFGAKMRIAFISRFGSP